MAPVDEWVDASAPAPAPPQDQWVDVDKPKRVKRYPGDPLSQLEARQKNPPASRYGDPKAAPEYGIKGVIGSAIKGGLGLIGADAEHLEGMFSPTEDVPTPKKIAEDNAAFDREQAAQKAELARQGAVGSIRGAASHVPLLGDPIAAVLAPAGAVAENRPVTPDENDAAIQSGVGLGAMLLPMAKGARAARLREANVLRAKGMPVPEVAPEAAPMEPPAPTQADTTPAQAPEPTVEAPAAPTATDAAPQADTPSASPTGAPDAPVAPPAAYEPTPAPPALPPVDDPGYGAALRTRHSGEANVRAAEGNQIANFIKKTLTPQEQDALTIMRDEKGNPGQTATLLDGTHPIYQEPGTSLAHVQALSDVAELALRPTDAMKQADGVLDSYFTKTLTEGRDLGVLDSSIAPENYISHLLQPPDAAEIDQARFAGPRGISESTPFANKRNYPTVLEAVARGLDPKTLNAADAVSIYAKRHGGVVASQILENTLKESDIGKWATPGTVPEGWEKIGGDTRTFKHLIAYADAEGNPVAAEQALYAPKKIVAALRPLIDPNYMLKVPGFQQLQRFQDYIKSANVALSFFHLKAMDITAFNSMERGPVDMVKAYMAPLDDPGFVGSERAGIQHGLKTSIVGQTAEAYRSLEPRRVPSKIDAVRNLPVMKQLDQVAGATSKLTFDITQRKMKVVDFASKDAAWIAQHPNATPVELATARRSIARAVNAFYGDLNWESLGISRTTHAIMRAFMFAPDWTYSNVESVTMMGRGGPGGAAARWFAARSITAGVGATAAMTYFFSGKKLVDVPGKWSTKLFQVYLGKDDKGNDKFINLFFAGMPNDAINLAGNVADFGAGKGVGMTIANKSAAIPRAGVHWLSNKDFMGRDIVPKDAGFTAGTALSVKNTAKDLSPTPFSLSNIMQMATDTKREYTPLEYAAAATAGTRPRHVKPQAERPERPRNSLWDVMANGAPIHKGGHQVPPPDGQRRYGELENEDMLTRTSPLAWLPDRFKSARDARVGSPFPPGAHNPPPTDPFRDTIGYEEGTAPPDASKDAPRWRGRFGFNVQDSAGMPEHQMAEISKAAGSSAPETMVHELMHGAYEDLTDQERATIDRLHIATVRASDSIYANRGRTSTTAVPLAERIAHEPEFHDAPHEWFSEVAAMYVANPSWLKESDPGVYGVLRKIFGREYIQAGAGR